MRKKAAEAQKTLQTINGLVCISGGCNQVRPAEGIESRCLVAHWKRCHKALQPGTTR